MSNILTNSLKKKHHHPDCYSSCRLMFSPCVCFASICANTAAKSYILNYMPQISLSKAAGCGVHRWF